MTLQEYFVAQYVTDHQLLEQMLIHYDDPWWEEVILLYAGSTPDASPLVRKLLGEDGTIREDLFQTGLIMAGRCLAARPTLQQPILWQNVTSDLFKTLTSTPYQFIAKQIAETLATLSDEVVSQRLILLVGNEQINSIVRRSIAEALGTLGERSVVPDLMKLLSNEQINSNGRGNIAEALGTLIDDEAMVFLLAKILPGSDIAESICQTLWTVSRRCHVRIFVNDQTGEKQLEVVKW